MANYVYKDVHRKKVVYTNEARKSNKRIRYYCPNENCTAHMYRRDRHGIQMSYFSAIPKHPHIGGCPYGERIDFNPSNYDESKFDFQTILTNLTTSTNKQNKRNRESSSKKRNNILTTPRTIGQIYNLCKSFHHEHAYNGIEIWRMLIDDRSIGMYSKGISGFRIIEAKCKKPMFYNTSSSEIKLITSILGNEYNLILKFEDISLFKTIKNKIYPNRDRVIVVAAEWKSTETGSIYQATFSNQRQLKII